MDSMSRSKASSNTATDQDMDELLLEQETLLADPNFVPAATLQRVPKSRDSAVRPVSKFRQQRVKDREDIQSRSKQIPREGPFVETISQEEVAPDVLGEIVERCWCAVGEDGDASHDVDVPQSGFPVPLRRNQKGISNGLEDVLPLRQSVLIPPTSRAQACATADSAEDVVKSETDAIIKRMSRDEIAQAQKEIEDRFGPKICSMLRKRGAAKLRDKERRVQQPPSRMQIEFKALGDARWPTVAVDEIDYAKLMWTSPLGAVDRLPSDTADFEDLSALRVDFEGRAQRRCQMYSCRECASAATELHHHGEEAAAAGYTMNELLHLAQSSSSGQRLLAVRALWRTSVKSRVPAALRRAEEEGASRQSAPNENHNAGFGVGLWRWRRFVFDHLQLHMALIQATFAVHRSLREAATSALGEMYLPAGLLVEGDGMADLLPVMDGVEVVHSGGTAQLLEPGLGVAAWGPLAGWDAFEDICVTGASPQTLLSAHRHCPSRHQSAQRLAAATGQQRKDQSTEVALDASVSWIHAWVSGEWQNETEREEEAKGDAQELVEKLERRGHPLFLDPTLPLLVLIRQTLADRLEDVFGNASAECGLLRLLIAGCAHSREAVAAVMEETASPELPSIRRCLLRLISVCLDGTNEHLKHRALLVGPDGAAEGDAGPTSHCLLQEEQLRLHVLAAVRVVSMGHPCEAKAWGDLAQPLLYQSIGDLCQSCSPNTTQASLSQNGSDTELERRMYATRICTGCEALRLLALLVRSGTWNHTAQWADDVPGFLDNPENLVLTTLAGWSRSVAKVTNGPGQLLLAPVVRLILELATELLKVTGNQQLTVLFSPATTLIRNLAASIVENPSDHGIIQETFYLIRATFSLLDTALRAMSAPDGIWKASPAEASDAMNRLKLTLSSLAITLVTPEDTDVNLLSMLLESAESLSAKSVMYCASELGWIDAGIPLMPSAPLGNGVILPLRSLLAASVLTAIVKAYGPTLEEMAVSAGLQSTEVLCSSQAKNLCDRLFGKSKDTQCLPPPDIVRFMKEISHQSRKTKPLLFSSDLRMFRPLWATDIVVQLNLALLDAQGRNGLMTPGYALALLSLPCTFKTTSVALSVILRDKKQASVVVSLLRRLLLSNKAESQVVPASPASAIACFAPALIPRVPPRIAKSLTALLSALIRDPTDSLPLFEGLFLLFSNLKDYPIRSDYEGKLFRHLLDERLITYGIPVKRAISASHAATALRVLRLLSDGSKKCIVAGEGPVVDSASGSHTTDTGASGPIEPSEYVLSEDQSNALVDLGEQFLESSFGDSSFARFLFAAFLSAEDEAKRVLLEMDGLFAVLSSAIPLEQGANDLICDIVAVLDATSVGTITNWKRPLLRFALLWDEAPRTVSVPLVFAILALKKCVESDASVKNEELYRYPSWLVSLVAKIDS